MFTIINQQVPQLDKKFIQKEAENLILRYISTTKLIDSNTNLSFDQAQEELSDIFLSKDRAEKNKEQLFNLIMHDDPDDRKNHFYLTELNFLIKNPDRHYTSDTIKYLNSNKLTEKQEADEFIEKKFLNYLASKKKEIKTNELNYKYPKKGEEQDKIFLLLSAVLNAKDTTLRLDKEMFERIKNDNYIEHMIDTFNEVTGKKADFNFLYTFIFQNYYGHNSKDILRALTNIMEYKSSDKNIANEWSERLKKMTKRKEKIGENKDLSSQIEMAKESKKFMVNIAKESARGSGVIYKVTEKYVYILTNHHVVVKKVNRKYDDEPINYADTIEVDFLADNVLNKKIKADIIKTGDGTNDIALIRVNKADIQFEKKTALGNLVEESKKGELHYIDANLRSNYDLEAPKYATKEEFDNFVRSRDDVIAIGNSSGLGTKNNETYASGFGKIISFQYGDLTHDAKIYSGNSGGAAFNKEGKIIGINYSVSNYNKDGVNITREKNADDVPYGRIKAYAVPSYIAKQFADRAIQKQEMLESQAGKGPSSSIQNIKIVKLPFAIKKKG